jgi:MraZ protein
VFISRFMPVLDSKGRFSLPPAFRDCLEARSATRTQLLIAEHPQHAALRCFDVGHASKLLSSIETKFGDDISAPQEQKSYELLSSLTDCSIDGGGRIILDDIFRSATGIHEDVLCLGMGHYFELWNPDTAVATIDSNGALKRYVEMQRASRKAKE